MPKNESFTDITEQFLVELVKEVQTTANVDIKTKVDVLKEMTRWVQVKNKVAPEGAEGSKIDEYRAALASSSATGSRGGNSRRVGRGGGAKARAQIDKIEATQGQKIPDGQGSRVTTSPSPYAVNVSGDGPSLSPTGGTFPKLDGGDSSGNIVSVVGGSNKSRSFGGL